MTARTVRNGRGRDGHHRVVTPAYTLTVNIPGFQMPLAAWQVRGSRYAPGFGRPTDENLRRYVERLEASTHPGAANGHLGFPVAVSSAFITHQATGEIVATYEAERIAA